MGRDLATFVIRNWMMDGIRVAGGEGIDNKNTPLQKKHVSSSYGILKKEDCEKNKKGYQRCPIQSSKE